MLARAPLLVVGLLLLPALLVASPAEACAVDALRGGVPCGRIYPSILMSIENQPARYPMEQGGVLTTEAAFTFKFDAGTEGYTVVTPDQPVVVSFEFPRKPGWAELEVEPERFEIPINDPTYLQPDLSQPTTPGLWFVYTTQIKITARLTGQPVLRDGYDFAKLLVFAKSTESGLYQAAYGIKELRVAPEGALHESDLAGTRDVFTPTPLVPFSIPGVSASVVGLTATLDPVGSATFWEPLDLGVKLDRGVQGRLMLALHDEWGNLVARAGPLDGSGGAATLPATFARPGLHTLTVTVLPEPGMTTPPLTIPLDFVAGDVSAEGFEYPKGSLVEVQEAVPAPTGHTAEARDQWVRDIPFFAFDTVQAVSATVSLVTPGLPDAGRGAALIQFTIIDPDGKMLGAAAIDPVNVPQQNIRIGSLPSEGWYTLRLTGSGLPTMATYHARIETTYTQPHQARNHADGTADVTGGQLSLGGQNLTLPIEELGVWKAAAFTPALEGADAWTYQMTIFDANGTLAYATGARSGSASFATPLPGTYRAFVFAEPKAPATPFSPFTRAFTFSVGEANETVVSTFQVKDAFEMPPGRAGGMLLGVLQVPSPVAGGTASGEAPAARLVYVGPDGQESDSLDPQVVGPHLVKIYAPTPAPPVGGPAEVTLQRTLAAPTTLGHVPDVVFPASGPATIPGLAVGLVLAVAGAVAVAVVMLRRR